MQEQNDQTESVTSESIPQPSSSPPETEPVLAPEETDPPEEESPVEDEPEAVEKDPITPYKPRHRPLPKRDVRAEHEARQVELAKERRNHLRRTGDVTRPEHLK